MLKLHKKSIANIEITSLPRQKKSDIERYRDVLGKTMKLLFRKQIYLLPFSIAVPLFFD